MRQQHCILLQYCCTYLFAGALSLSFCRNPHRNEWYIKSLIDKPFLPRRVNQNGTERFKKGLTKKTQVRPQTTIN